MLLMLFCCTQLCNGGLNGLTLTLGLLLPPGMVQTIESVESFPPTLCLDELFDPLVVQTIAVPGFLQRVTEGAAAW